MRFHRQNEKNPLNCFSLSLAVTTVAISRRGLRKGLHPASAVAAVIPGLTRNLVVREMAAPFRQTQGRLRPP